MVNAEVNRVIASFVGVLIGIVLAPIIFTVAEDTNVTGTTATIIALVPTFFALAVLLLAVRGLAT